MKIRPDTFLTADTHFGHSKLYTEWNHRKQGFEEEIIKAWNSVVRVDDTVLHLGDLTMTNKEATQAWTLRLNGHKYLVRGNHDGASDSWYRDCGFETIPACLWSTHDKYDTALKILFTHEPVIPLPVDWFNIHGHLHGDNHRNILTSNCHFDVGVDAHGLTPIRLYDIIPLFIKIMQHG